MELELREAIRRRAYQIFVARENDVHDPEADWLQAEMELSPENGIPLFVGPAKLPESRREAQVTHDDGSDIENCA